MTTRLIPIELFRGHWKGLSDYRAKTTLPDKITRFSIIVLPLSAAVAISLPGGSLAAPGALLAGVALLAGGFLAAFGQISTLRLRLTDRAREYGEVEQIDRDALDETAAHLLVASFLSGVTALLIVLSMNFGIDANGAVTGVWAGLVVAPASYVLLVFIIAVPRLYAAYVKINSVRDELSGMHKEKR